MAQLVVLHHVSVIPGSSVFYLKLRRLSLNEENFERIVAKLKFKKILNEINTEVG